MTPQALGTRNGLPHGVSFDDARHRPHLVDPGFVVIIEVCEGGRDTLGPEFEVLAEDLLGRPAMVVRGNR